MSTTEELKQERDRILAMLMDVWGKQDSKLQKELEKLVDVTTSVDEHEGFTRYQRYSLLKYLYSRMSNIFGTKKIRTYVLLFLAGVLVALIPSLLYINTLKKDNTPPLIFTPNAMAEKKPVYIQVFKTPEEVEAVKKTKIYLSEEATIGAGVRVSTKGLDMFTKKELDGPEVHLKYVGPQEKGKVVIGDYTYIPNYILTMDPAPAQVLENEDQVRAAQNMKGLTYKENLEVGAIIQCPSTYPCYVITKSGVADRVILKPFESSKP